VNHARNASEAGVDASGRFNEVAIPTRRARVAPHAADFEGGFSEVVEIELGCVILLGNAARLRRIHEGRRLRDDAGNEDLEIPVADVIGPHPDPIPPIDNRTRADRTVERLHATPRRRSIAETAGHLSFIGSSRSTTRPTRAPGRSVAVYFSNS